MKRKRVDAIASGQLALLLPKPSIKSRVHKTKKDATKLYSMRFVMPQPIKREADSDDSHTGGVADNRPISRRPDSVHNKHVHNYILDGPDIDYLQKFHWLRMNGDQVDLSKSCKIVLDQNERHTSINTTSAGEFALILLKKIILRWKLIFFFGCCQCGCCGVSFFFFFFFFL